MFNYFMGFFVFVFVGSALSGGLSMIDSMSEKNKAKDFRLTYFSYTVVLVTLLFSFWFCQTTYNF